MGWPAYRLHHAVPTDEWRWAVGRRRGLALKSSSARTSTIAGAPGRPIRRANCCTVISVGEGMAASTSKEDMDAMFQPRPYGAIAVDPLTSVHITPEQKSIFCALGCRKLSRAKLPQL